MPNGKFNNIARYFTAFIDWVRSVIYSIKINRNYFKLGKNYKLKDNTVNAKEQSRQRANREAVAENVDRRGISDNGGQETREENLEYILFKHPHLEREFLGSKINHLIFIYTIKFSREFYAKWGQRIVVTDLLSTWARDKRLGRKGSSHREGRGIDIRNKNWTAEQVIWVYKWWRKQPLGLDFVFKIDQRPHGTGRHCHIHIVENKRLT